MRVDSDINALFKQSFFDFFSEKSFALEFVKAQVLDSISFCLNDFDAGLQSYFLQFSLNEMGLPQREVTSSGANDNRVFQCREFWAKLASISSF